MAGEVVHANDEREQQDCDQRGEMTAADPRERRKVVSGFRQGVALPWLGRPARAAFSKPKLGRDAQATKKQTIKPAPPPASGRPRWGRPRRSPWRRGCRLSFRKSSRAA